MVRYNFSRFNDHRCHCYYNKLCMVHFGCHIHVFVSDLTVFYFSSIFRIHVRWQEVTLSYVRMAHRDNETFYHSFSIYNVTLY